MFTASSRAVLIAVCNLYWNREIYHYAVYNSLLKESLFWTYTSAALSGIVLFKARTKSTAERTLTSTSMFDRPTVINFVAMSAKWISPSSSKWLKGRLASSWDNSSAFCSSISYNENHQIMPSAIHLMYKLTRLDICWSLFSAVKQAPSWITSHITSFCGDKVQYRRATAFGGPYGQSSSVDCPTNVLFQCIVPTLDWDEVAGHFGIGFGDEVGKDNCVDDCEEGCGDECGDSVEYCEGDCEGCAGDCEGDVEDVWVDDSEDMDEEEDNNGEGDGDGIEVDGNVVMTEDNDEDNGEGVGVNKGDEGDKGDEENNVIVGEDEGEGESEIDGEETVSKNDVELTKGDDDKAIEGDGDSDREGDGEGEGDGDTVRKRKNKASYNLILHLHIRGGLLWIQVNFLPFKWIHYKSTFLYSGMCNNHTLLCDNEYCYHVYIHWFSVY